jgi:secreted PhoX family phosphatase
MGHIVRWKPQGQDAASDRFDWEIFVLAGDPDNTDLNQKGNIRGDVYGSPDGLWFDQRGILWTQTDISSGALGKDAYSRITNNMMFAADPVSREFRRFLIGPNGCEVTGVDLTPDYKTMFVNIQHPGESPSERSNPDKPKAFSDWPDRKLFSRPRSATIAIWREDGKPVGS